MHRRVVTALVLIAPSASPVVAQTAVTRAFDFSIPSIMRGPEIYGREPQRVRWSADGRWLYFQWNPPGTDWREPPHLYRVRSAGGASPTFVRTVSSSV